MISFTLPWALAGLVAATLPLLLHLVQRHDVPEVPFPAVRYLEDATRQQQRRLQFRNWLLLLVRTLLIMALVFAAAGMTMRRTRFGTHVPSALVLVVDNCAASAAVVDGEPILAGLVRAGSGVLDHALPGDRVWLIAADGIARSGTAAQLRQHLAALRAEPLRLDLGGAMSSGRDLIRGSGRAGEVVVVSALQRTALGISRGIGPVLVIRPTSPVPRNRGIVELSAGTQPWGADGGRVTISIVSNDTAPVPVTLAVGGRPMRDVLVAPGTASVERIGPQPPGWIEISATLPPDEFRLDDQRSIPVRVAPPTPVQWDSADRYVAAAAAVLAADRRIRPGTDVQIGDLGNGPAVVIPPDDPARVGALNRRLAARGVPWRFGTLIDAAQRIDSSHFLPARDAVTRRYTLESTGQSGEVLATVNGEPWVVRGGGVVLVGSRLDPAWTALPLSASFVPLVDALLTGAVRGELDYPDVVAGEPIALPRRVTGVAHDGRVTSMPGDGRWVPRDVGVFHLLAGADTLGAIAVRIDARESDLRRATDSEVHALWPGSIVAGLRDGPALAFAAGGRADLRGALLLLAFCCALAETILAGRVRKRD
ncbi:MAG TPA: BatA domain-containing protein [Gemmatimonadales bacterium]